MASTTGHLSSFVASWWQYNSSRVGVFTPAKCPASCIRYLGVKYTLLISLSKKGGHKTKTVLLSTNAIKPRLQPSSWQVLHSMAACSNLDETALIVLINVRLV